MFGSNCSARLFPAPPPLHSSHIDSLSVSHSHAYIHHRVFYHVLLSARKTLSLLVYLIRLYSSFRLLLRHSFLKETFYYLSDQLIIAYFRLLRHHVAFVMDEVVYVCVIIFIVVSSPSKL